MFQDVSAKYSKDENVTFGVFGGPGDSEELMERIKSKLEQISVNPQTVKKLTDRSVAIDSRSGEILENIKITNMGDDMKLRLMGAGIGINDTPLHRSYDGRKKGN